jgi:DNA-binding NarL/FixJ family response regulator
MDSHVRVLVVDGQRMFSDALQLLLATEEDIDVVDVAPSAEAAFALITGGRRDPDVVVMDVDLPGMSGVAATERLRAAVPHVRVVVITEFTDHEVLERAMAAGASGFVSKHRTAEDLLRAIRRAAAGDEFFEARDVHALMRAARTPRHRREHDLTDREVEVLQGLAEGSSTEELAARLFVSRRTVQGHVQSILTKLGVHSKLGAVLYGLRHHLVRLPPDPDDDA